MPMPGTSSREGFVVEGFTEHVGVPQVAEEDLQGPRPVRHRQQQTEEPGDAPAASSASITPPDAALTARCMTIGLIEVVSICWRDQHDHGQPHRRPDVARREGNDHSRDRPTHGR